MNAPAAFDLASLTPAQRRTFELLGRPRDQLAVPVIPTWSHESLPIDLVACGFSPPEAAMLLAWAYVGADRTHDRYGLPIRRLCHEAACIVHGLPASRGQIVESLRSEHRDLARRRRNPDARAKREALATILTALGEDPTNP